VDFSEVSKDPVKWLEYGLRDPHTMFKKSQVEPARKPDGRIIMGESIVDQLVHRFFFQNFMEVEASLYPNLCNLKTYGLEPEKIGPLFDTYQHLYDTHGVAFCSDVSGWERGFSEDTADFTVSVFRGTCVNDSGFLDRAMQWWKYSLLSSVMIDKGGVLFCLNRLQGMRSGNLLTNTANGLGRAGVAFYNGARDVRSNGDDCIEFHIAGTCPIKLKEKYLITRTMVREFTPQERNRFSFSSRVFIREPGRTYSYLTTYDRMFVQLLRTMHIDSSRPHYVEGYLSSIFTEIVDHPDLFVKASAVVIADVVRAVLYKEVPTEPVRDYRPFRTKE
jgi:hypothetical protein